MSAPHITRMLDFTRYVIVLSCGHRFEVTKEDAKNQQLFIGKRIVCAECEQPRKKRLIELRKGDIL
jgi:hypothetical protein